MISILIPTHGHARGLKPLLESITSQLDPPPHEVLVISNLEDPATKRLVRSFGFTHLEAGAIGVNRARNLGIENARGEHLFFLDDDCRLQNQSHLKTLQRLHDKNPDLAGIGGPYLLAKNANAWDRVYNRTQLQWLKSGERISPETEHLLGGNCSFKRSALLRHRFDSELVFGGTETELLARLARHGCRTRLFPELALEHATGLGARAFFRKAYLQGTGAARLERARNAWKIGSRAKPSALIFEIPFQAGFARANAGKSLPASSLSIAAYSFKEACIRAIRFSRLKLAKEFLAPLRASAKIRATRPSPLMNKEKCR